MSGAGSTSAPSSASKNESLARQILGHDFPGDEAALPLKKEEPPSVLGGSAYFGRVKGPRSDAIRQVNPEPFSSRVKIEVSAVVNLRHGAADGAEEVEPLQVRAEAPAWF